MLSALGFALEPSASTAMEIVARASRETVRVGPDYVVVPVVRFAVVVRFADRRALSLGEFVRPAARAGVGVYETALGLLPDCAGLRLLEGREAGTAAAARAEFGSAVDEYRYRLTVEWDQRDLGRRAEIVREFEDRVKGLFATGLETDDAFAVLADRTNDPAFAKDLRAFRESNARRPFDRARVLRVVLDYGSPEKS